MQSCSSIGSSYAIYNEDELSYLSQSDVPLSAAWYKLSARGAPARQQQLRVQSTRRCEQKICFALSLFTGAFILYHLVQPYCGIGVSSWGTGEHALGGWLQYFGVAASQ
jgi:hypothetical protein